MEYEAVDVSCFSGHTFADRPTGFVWRGAKTGVKEVEKEWLEPGEKHFRIKTEDDRLFELCYYEDDDRWLAAQKG